MSESVRNLWALSLSQCAAVNNAMMELTSLTVKASKQHIDVSEARRKRDVKDFIKFREWLAERNPLTFTNGNLHSFHAGWTSIAGRDYVNCDEAEELGASIHKKT